MVKMSTTWKRGDTKYIRNADIKKVAKKYLTAHRGVAISEYTGTIAYAKKKRIPVFDYKGNWVWKPAK